ncbi:MAG TPA: hypothetical protein VJG64_00795 [Candidatus Paceibacterota bacterium]
MPYSARLKQLLTPPERRAFQKLSTPQKIQDFLDDLPINFELLGETYMSPRRVLRERTAHCFEGALFAAAALAYHGKKPLLLDLKSIDADQDHVVAPFKEAGRWGAISKTNHAILRYRDPIYLSVRELAMSFVNEYIMDDGRKSMRSYSAPFSLSRYPPDEWITREEDLVPIVDALDDSKHFPIAPEKAMRRMRRALPFEVDKLAWQEEWLPGRKPRRAKLLDRR